MEKDSWVFYGSEEWSHYQVTGQNLNFICFIPFLWEKTDLTQSLNSWRRSLGVPQTSSMPLSSLGAGSIYTSLFPHLFTLLRSRHNYLSLLQHQRALLTECCLKSVSVMFWIMCWSLHMRVCFQEGSGEQKFLRGGGGCASSRITCPGCCSAHQQVK